MNIYKAFEKMKELESTDGIRRQVETTVSILHKMIDDNEFFDKQNLGKMKIDKLTKKQLIEIIIHLNTKMVESAEWWDGG